MGIIYFNKQKDCCTCQYWQEPRKISTAKDKVEVTGSAVEGVCSNPKSGTFKGKKTKAGYSGCVKHEKWDKLK